MAAGVLLCGCTKDVEPVVPSTPSAPSENEDGTTTVTFNFSTMRQEVETRATDEDAMTNVKLLLVGEDGTRYYYELEEGKTSVVTTIKRGIYTVYATTFISLTYGDLLETLINYLYTPYYDESDTSLIMSFKGVADFSEGKSNEYPVKLMRTVAKLRFNIKTASDVVIKSMSLHNAPKQAKLFPQANPGNNYEERVLSVPANGSCTVYMPENLAGTVSSITHQRQRTSENAPEKATYLKIVGELADKTHVEYRVYLGSNTTDDFNVKRNNDYRIDINIASDWSTDYRITGYKASHAVSIKTTPDGKYIANFSDAAKLMPSFTTNAADIYSKVSYEYVFRGNQPGQLSINGTTLIGNTYSGTLTNGQTHTLTITNKASVISQQHHLVTYTLTFTDEYGGTTEYTGELRWANIISIVVSGVNTHSYIELTFSENASIADARTGIRNLSYIVYCPGNPFSMSILTKYGYAFKGWYRDAECTDLISESSSTNWALPSKECSIWAKID
jgi:hypothetical protein